VRIACFYPASIYSAWSCSQGLVDTLRLLGHEVKDAPVDPNATKLSRREFPLLEEVDLVLVSGPEHIQQHIAAIYPDFGKLKAKKLGWLHETVEREDYGKLPLEPLKVYDTVYCPALQDEKFGLKYLPFGVDTNVFRPSGLEPHFDLGFIGLLYGKRQKWLSEAGIENLRMARVEANGPMGTDVRWSALLLAESYRSFRVFLNLPTLSQLLVTKIYEVMACGVALVTPYVNANCDVFENGKHLQYYENNPKGIIQQLLESPEYCRTMAVQGMNEVHEKHSLKSRCEVLLASA
jgi:hypothetical protein